MLKFFRAYQQFFFIIITVMIVVSFSFVGTYNTFASKNRVQDDTLFTTYYGTNVKRSEVDEMVRFIGTDQLDSLILGMAIGPNILNDGVVRKDFLQSGLADELVAKFSDSFNQQWQERYVKERKFSPYRHQEVEFIGATNVWGQYAPELKNAFISFKKASDLTALELFQAKSRLFLAEKAFPQVMTKQVLAFLMKQNGFAKADPQMASSDLSLFGYHTLADWFGQDFLRLISEVIINGAEIATAEGIVVTKDEALQDLIAHAKEAFNIQKNNPDAQIESPASYLQQQLHAMGFDTNGAAKLWQKVMLFRKLVAKNPLSLQDVATLKPYADYLEEKVTVLSHHLPQEVRLAKFLDLQLFETYLDHLTFGSGKELRTPLNVFWKSSQEVAGATPELVYKRYLVDICHVDKNEIAAKVGIKEMWRFEASEENFALLQKEFKELGSTLYHSDDERLAALDNLEPSIRAKVDRKARFMVVDLHPEWVVEALNGAPFKQETLTFYKAGAYSPLAGVKNPQMVMTLLDSATIEEGALPLQYAEGNSFYRIRLLDRSPDFEIASFEKAEKEGQLQPLLTKKLQEHYLEVQKRGDESFKLADGRNKAFEDVKEELAKELFRNTIRQVQKENALAKNLDQVAAYRHESFLKALSELLKNDPIAFDRFVRQERGFEVANVLTDALAPVEQFKLVAQMESWGRQKAVGPLPLDQLMQFKEGDISKVYSQNSGDLYFFKVESVKREADATDITTLKNSADSDMTNAKNRLYFSTMIDTLKAHGALKLNEA